MITKQIFENEEFLTEKEAANYLKFSQKALQKWRCIGSGPRFIRVSSKAVRYRKSDLIDWALKRVVNSTTEILPGECGE